MPEKISVLMPVYNAMPFLPDAVDSILKQTFEDFIFYIVNDGSTDDSLNYLESLSDRRIRILNKKNSGLVDTLNYALQFIDTPFIARMDADDLCVPERLKLQYEYLKNKNEIVLIGSSANHIGIFNNKGKMPIHMPLTHSKIISSMFNRHSAIIHPTILIRTEAIKKVGGYRKVAWPAEDYDLYLRLSKTGNLANLKEILYSIRLHNNSITSNSIIKAQQKYNEVLNLHLGIASSSRNILSNLDYRSVYFYRKGLNNFVNNRKVLGIIYELFSMFLNPKRTFTYLSRKIKNYLNISISHQATEA